MHHVYCQNVDYMDSFIAIQILYLLLNAKLIYYAFCYSDTFIIGFMVSRRMLKKSI